MNEEKLKEMMSRWLTKEEVKECVDYLKTQGKTVYSISRLNSYHTCKYGYHLVYHLHERGENNVYAILGGIIHDYLQNVHENNMTMKEIAEKYPQDIEFNTLFTPFPSENIGNSWISDMTNFINNFKGLPYNHENIKCEQGFIIEITEGVFLQGYIDILIEDNNDFIVMDWKTSSEFKGEHLIEAGRQLLLYSMAVKKITGKYPKQICWIMLKYYNLTDLNTGKTTQANRGSWVKKISGKITTQLKKMGMYDEMLLDVAIRQNDISLLPKEIQDRYKLEDCYVYYDITKENMEELYDYLVGTITEIESRDKDNTMLWQPSRKSADFFCQNLCSNYCRCFGKDMEEN